MREAMLLEACRLARDDDEPRLVWADHVGGERGELVVVQCELARGARSPGEMAALRRRERELLATHGAAWAGLRDHASRWEFRRGFVEAAAIDVARFVANEAAIGAAAPLLAVLSATGLTGSFSDDDGQVRGPQTLALVRALLEAPAFWQLEGLEIVGAGVNESSGDGYGRRFTGLGDEVAEVLARAGALGQLRALGFAQSDVSARGVHALVGSGDLGGLERLWLRENHDLGIDATLALLRAAPNLRSLALGATELAELAPALGRLSELELGLLGPGDLVALSHSPVASTVESLQVIGELAPMRALERWPRLRTLDLRAATIGPRDEPHAIGPVRPRSPAPGYAVRAISPVYGREAVASAYGGTRGAPPHGGDGRLAAHDGDGCAPAHGGDGRRPAHDGGASGEGLASLALPTLRQIRVGARISVDDVRAIAHGFGAQLELLDARGVTGLALEELAPLVAGEVLLGPYPHERRLL